MSANRKITVGLIGFGTVGTGVVQALRRRAEIRGDVQLRAVAVADPAKPREVPVPKITGNALEVVADPEIDLVVEVMGGEQPALDLIREALNRGKSVVTANKAVLSRHLPELSRLARDRKVDLAFEASVAGSIPIIRTLRGFEGERILRLTGILNGTSNYILTRMEEGLDFDKALLLARERGFAEAEHHRDTGGFDARDKLAILAALAFNTPVDPDAIHCEGITAIAPADLDFAARYGLEEGGDGHVIRSLATARLDTESDAIELHVYPALIRRDHPLAAVREEMNAVYLEGELCGPQLYLGRGAGRAATASAVLADILRVAGNIRRGIVDPPPSFDRRARLADIGGLRRRGYVRMNLKHVPGSIAETARILGEHGFNIEDSVQRRRFRVEVGDEVFIPDIVTVEALPYGIVGEALAALRASHRVQGEPFYLRFEE